jgi:hypothetical protein
LPAVPGPVGFENSATDPDLAFYAARSYSLMRLPRTGRRLIRRERSATGWSGRGGRSWRLHGERHLRTVLAEFESHYNHHRPHRGRSLYPPIHDPSEAIDMTARINRQTAVSGLINEYHRAA